MDKIARVLLVEDNDASAEDYADWLRAVGYDVHRASGVSDAYDALGALAPEVVVLDLQIPSGPNRADEDVRNGFAVLESAIRLDPFRPIVILTAHSNDRALMRDVLQRTRGGGFVFKDDERLRTELTQAVAVALANPAFRTSRIVKEFRTLISGGHREDVYRQFIRDHWRAILGPEYQSVESPYEVARGAEIDLLAVRHDGFADLWELKRPDQPMFEPYNQWLHHSAECARAIGQIINYYKLAERETARDALAPEVRRHSHIKLHRPRGFVVIGRCRDERERELLRIENGFYAGIVLMTYDDLLERADALLGFLSNVSMRQQ